MFVGDDCAVGEGEIGALFDTQTIVVGHIIEVAHIGFEVEQRRILFEDETVSRHRVAQGESCDFKPIVRMNHGWLVSVNIDDGKRIVDMRCGYFKKQVDGFACSGRCIDGEGILASAEVHSGEQSGESKEVVAVKMGNENCFNRLNTLMILSKLSLSGFTAIEQDM